MRTKADGLDARQIATLLNLAPHPREGGWFVETYRARETVRGTHLPTRYGGERSFGTAIFYLLTSETRSLMHRLASDEVFHFYLGDPVTMLNLHPDGTAKIVTLGPDIRAGQCFQHVVPRGTWQGCCLPDGGRWALLGCTVAPGFDYRDYESGSREDLIAEFAAHRDLIIQLTDG